MRLVLKNETPISQKPHRLLAPEQIIVNNQVDEWIRDGIIEPCASEYASPVVIMKKKDGNARVCIDYRKLKNC